MKFRDCIVQAELIELTLPHVAKEKDIPPSNAEVIPPPALMSMPNDSC